MNVDILKKCFYCSKAEIYGEYTLAGVEVPLCRACASSPIASAIEDKIKRLRGPHEN